MPGTSTVVLIVAHGSRNPSAAEEHERFCSAVREAVTEPLAGEPLEIRSAYLEITEPSVSTAIADAVSGGATDIVVLPHFLNSGNHVLVDLPGIVEDASQRFPDVAVRLGSHLGANPALVRLTVDAVATTVGRTRAASGQSDPH